MRGLVKVLAAVTCAVLVPTSAYAQAAIAGQVKDSSGAVLPGVTVEASSPALIEKVRTVVTDSNGQYRVIDLRAGAYSVTFTLPGFNAVKRDGIQLSGNFTATVDVELRVGSVEETVTVTGEAPVVDVQSARRQQVLDNEVISALPTGRGYQNLLAVIPSVANPTGPSQDVGGDRGDVQPRYASHGSQMTDSRVQVDGMTVGSTATGGSSGTFYITPAGMSQEVIVNISGALAESDTGGVVVNVIPREGGNALRGIFFLTGANGSMQSSNYTQELRDRGLRAPNTLDKVWDINPAIGGPVVRDKVWYFLNVRYWGANGYVAGMFHNKNVNDPNSWTYEPDLARQALNDSNWWSGAVRLTWQATPRNKINVFWDEQRRCVSCDEGGSPTLSPEASGRSAGYPNRVYQATWTAPLTNRVLFEAGVSTYYAHWFTDWRPGEEFHLRIPVTEQAGLIPGLQYHGSGGNQVFNRSPVVPWRGSMSYVTGAHNVKVGMNGTHFDKSADVLSNTSISYRFNNGVPNQLTQSAATYRYAVTMENIAAYAQDQWTVRRLTLSSGIRYDHWHASSPAQQFGPSRFVPDPIVFSSEKHSNFHDISPRIGAAYNAFGDGRTAVKASLGRYVAAQESDSLGLAAFGSGMNPIVRLATNTARSWNDLNRNFVPDCDLISRDANGECGAMANQNFGLNVPNVTFDPEVTQGWRVRPYSWEFSAGVEQEIMPRISATVAYFRRWYGNFAVTDNMATTAADYSLFALPLPVDSRLPNSGGSLTGVADLVPAKFGQVSNVVTAASNYGEQIMRWNGVDLIVNARAVSGVTMQGGVTVGRLLLDNCEVAAKLPETNFSVTYSGVTNSNVWTAMEDCRVKQPFQTIAKLLGAYTIPRIDLQVSGTLQNIPGPEIKAFYNAPNAVVAPVLGRNLSGNAANITASLLPPLSTYGDRIVQLDFRIGKILRFGGTRSQVNVDLYNALNSSAIQSQNNTFGPQWLTPTGTMTGRLVKIGMQLDF